MNLYLYLFIVCVCSYIIGSIPTGYILVKLIKNEDIRSVGSGSTGATNVKRVLGKTGFFATLIIDVIKGAAPVLAAIYFSKLYGDSHSLGPVLAALFVVVGHSKSVFINFKGGKSVASGVGTIFALSWQAGLIAAFFWATFTYFTRYVSVGSIIAMVMSPFLMYFFHKPLIYVAYCAFGAAYITYLHRENIARLRKGEENKVR